METNLSIMASGGLDSFIAWHYAIKNGYKPLALFVDMGQPYNWKEWKGIKEIQKVSNVIVTKINIKDLIPAIAEKMTNQIIPSRNVFLATIGSMFNNRVWINALDGEQNGKENDKSLRFFQDTTNLLSFTNSFFQDSTIVETPFSHLSKAETIRWALDNGITKEQLFKTTSCYDGEIDKCGVCLTCYKRKIAFLLNDIDEPGYHMDPLISDYAGNVNYDITKAHEDGDYSRFTEKRIKEHFILQEKIKALY